MTKTMQLPPRTKLYGWDYNTDRQLRMTGKEWHAYAKRTEFKTERGSDSAWGSKCEVWLDGTDQRKQARNARDIDDTSLPDR
jgi:hypothetical protein